MNIEDIRICIESLLKNCCGEVGDKGVRESNARG
jgi:hypothetical protein